MFGEPVILARELQVVHVELGLRLILAGELWPMLAFGMLGRELRPGNSGELWLVRVELWLMYGKMWLILAGELWLMYVELLSMYGTCGYYLLRSYS